MRRSFFAALGILVLAAFGVVLAETEPVGNDPPAMDQPPISTITGAVVTSSGTSLTIRTDAGTQMTFKVDRTTTHPEGLAGGNRVSVEYRTLEGGKYQATLVATEPMDAPAATTS